MPIKLDTAQAQAANANMSAPKAPKGLSDSGLAALQSGKVSAQDIKDAQGVMADFHKGMSALMDRAHVTGVGKAIRNVRPDGAASTNQMVLDQIRNIRP